MSEELLEIKTGLNLCPLSLYCMLYNNFKDWITSPLSLVGSNIVKRNKGYVTENSSVVTLPANSTSVTVEHGLAKVPLKVLITPLGQPPGKLWVENITDTSFDIVTDTAPSADLKIAWYAEL